MKKKASPSDASVLIHAARDAGRKSILKALYSGFTVHGSENGEIVGYNFSTHPMTKNLQVSAKLENHPKSNY